MSKIQWCDETINPVVGCSKISAGCQNCYAEKMARRLACMNFYQYQDVIGVERNGTIKGEWNGTTAFVPSELEKPYRWKKPRTIFVSSMGDLFHDSVPFEWIDQVVACAALNPQHTFILLTKRAERMKKYFCDSDLEDRITEIWQGGDPDKETWNIMLPLENLILGVSVEDQATADERIPVLLQIPAAKRFISYEPAVGPVDFTEYFEKADNGAPCPEIHQIICGGESGPKARCLNPYWVRSVRDQCEAAGTAFMFKQWSRWVGPGAGTVFGWFEPETGLPMLDGRTHTELAWEVRK